MHTDEKKILLSIIIINFETPDFAMSLLHSLGSDDDVEIIVVDNSRRNNLQKKLEKTHPYVQYFYTGKNLGFSGGINYGVRKAKGQWIMVLNTDTKASIPDIKKMILIAEKNNVKVAAPKLTSKDGTTQNNVGELPHFSHDPINWLLKQPSFHDCKMIGEEKKVSLLTGTAMLIQHSIFADIGHFDEENYFVDFVDFDFSKRLHEKNIDILYIPQVTIVHYKNIPFLPNTPPRLTILGSGTAISELYDVKNFRYPPAYLLRYEQSSILIDCSEGVRSRLNEIGFDYYNLDTIIISHLHPDHFSIIPLLQSIYQRAQQTTIPKYLTIMGPPGIKEAIQTIWNVSNTSMSYENDLIKHININYIELQDSKEYNLNETLMMTAYNVKHEEKMDSFAIKYTFPHCNFVYSGDTEICEGIRLATEEADYLLCGANCNEEEDCKGQLSYYQAGLLSEEAHIKNLILTHYSGKDSTKIMEEEVKKSGYKGRMLVAHDFQDFSLI